MIFGSPNLLPDEYCDDETDSLEWLLPLPFRRREGWGEGSELPPRLTERDDSAAFAAWVRSIIHLAASWVRK